MDEHDVGFFAFLFAGKVNWDRLECWSRELELELELWRKDKEARGPSHVPALTKCGRPVNVDVQVGDIYNVNGNFDFKF